MDHRGHWTRGLRVNWIPEKWLPEGNIPQEHTFCDFQNSFFTVSLKFFLACHMKKVIHGRRLNVTFNDGGVAFSLFKDKILYLCEAPIHASIHLSIYPSTFYNLPHNEGISQMSPITPSPAN